MFFRISGHVRQVHLDVHYGGWDENNESQKLLDDYFDANRKEDDWDWTAEDDARAIEKINQAVLDLRQASIENEQRQKAAVAAKEVEERAEYERLKAKFGESNA